METQHGALGALGEGLTSEDIGGEQIGRTLEPSTLKAEELPSRSGEERLAHPGGAFQEQVSPRDERDQELFDELALASKESAERLLEISAQRGIALRPELWSELIERRSVRLCFTALCFTRAPLIAAPRSLSTLAHSSPPQRRSAR